MSIYEDKSFKDYVNELPAATDVSSTDIVSKDKTTGNVVKADGNTLAKRSVQEELVESIASAFDPTRTAETSYKKEDAVTYGGRLYVFISDHYGEWDNNDVEERNVGEVLSALVRVNQQQLYISAGGSLYVEESNVSHGSIYIKAVNGTWNAQVNKVFAYTNSEFATMLGLSVTTSPKGITDCIELQSDFCIVFRPIRNDFVVRYRASVRGFNTVVIGCVSGKVVSNGIVFNGNVNVKEISLKSDLLFAFTQDCQFFYDGEYNKNSNKIYFTYTKYMSVRGKIYGQNVSKDFNVSQLASDLGVSTTTSPNGLSDTIEIPASSCLAFNIVDGKFKISSAISEHEIRLIENRGGRLVGGVLLPQINRLLVQQKEAIQVYVGGNVDLYVEEHNYSHASLYVRFPTLVVRGIISKSYTLAQIATATSHALTSSPNGVSNVYEIADAYSLCVTSSGLVKYKPRAEVCEDDVVIIACVNGHIVKGSIVQYLFRMSYTNGRVVGIAPYNGCTSGSFAASLSEASGETDTLLFYSDPHFLGENGIVTDAEQSVMNKLFSLIGSFAHTNNVDCVVCGGDVLNKNDTQAEAFQKLGYFVKMSKNLFKRSIVLNGNHDENDYGYINDSKSEPNTGHLTISQRINALFQDVGKSWYSYDKSYNTDYYILDTSRNEQIMSSNRWLQIDWLANKLLNATKPHAVVMMHIYSTSSDSADWASRITDMAKNLQILFGALNSRSTCTLNGIAYDFTNALQKVAVILCGHTHYDYIDNTSNVPVVAITKAVQTNAFAADAIVLDYSASEMRCTRIGGYGSNRTIAIVS